MVALSHGENAKLEFEVEGIISFGNNCPIDDVNLLTSGCKSKITTVTKEGNNGLGVYKFSINNKKLAQTISFNVKIKFKDQEFCRQKVLTIKVFEKSSQANSKIVVTN